MTTSEVIKIQRLLGLMSSPNSLQQDGIIGKKTSHALKLFKRQVRKNSINIIFNDIR